MGFRFENPYLDTAFKNDPTDKSQKRIVDENHLAFIRKLPSILSGKRPCEACHIRYGDPKRRKRKTPLSRKPDDAWVVPMTADEHRLQHSGNEQEFYRRLGLDPIEIALQLYQVSGDVERGTEIVMQNLARRT